MKLEKYLVRILQTEEKSMRRKQWEEAQVTITPFEDLDSAALISLLSKIMVCFVYIGLGWITIMANVKNLDS